MPVQLDIVIPCKNSYSQKKYSIYYTIKMILAQKNANYRVFVVDDNCTDETFLLLEQDFIGRKNIEFVKNNSSEGVASARNEGAKKGNSPYILFVDDDTLLYDEHTLWNTLTNYADYSFSCGAHRLWTPLNWHEHILKFDTPKSWMNILKNISFLPKGVDRVTGMIDLNHISFIGNYGLIKRDVFETMNGFPILYEGWGMEDTHLMYALCINDYDYGIFSEKEITVFHLNHILNKNDSFIRNYNQFQKHQQDRGLLFNESAFFNQEKLNMPVLKTVQQ